MCRSCFFPSSSIANSGSSESAESDELAEFEERVNKWGVHHVVKTEACETLPGAPAAEWVTAVTSDGGTVGFLAVGREIPWLMSYLCRVRQLTRLNADLNERWGTPFALSCTPAVAGGSLARGKSIEVAPGGLSLTSNERERRGE
jgi:hypothetical protein